MTLFVSGYIQVMEAEKPAIKPLMAAHLIKLGVMLCCMYGWESICTFHAVWLHKLEHGCMTWADEDAKLKLQRALIWHQLTASGQAMLQLLWLRRSR